MLPSHHLQLDDCGCCCCVFLLTPPPGTYEWSRSVLSWKSQSLNFPMGEFDWVSGFVHAIGRYGLVIGYWMGSSFLSIFLEEWVSMRNEKPIFVWGVNLRLTIAVGDGVGKHGDINQQKWSKRGCHGISFARPPYRQESKHYQCILGDIAHVMFLHGTRVIVVSAFHKRSRFFSAVERLGAFKPN